MEKEYVGTAGYKVIVDVEKDTFLLSLLLKRKLLFTSH